MKLARVPNEPSVLIDFFQEGLETLGAVSERSWHDRLQVVAEGAAARLWNPEGTLLETELHFVSPGEAGPRDANREVFPGCPLTFHMAEALRPHPVPLERAILQAADAPKPPSPEVAEKLWHAQIPGTSHWRLTGAFAATFHFSLLSLVRCEVQAIDQHWSVHRVAVSLPDGEPDETLAANLDFAQLADAGEVPWPQVELKAWEEWMERAVRRDLETDLVGISQRQQRYLRRELERIDAYFEGYKNELAERKSRSHSDSTRLKAEERLAAATSEHARRREDQIRRHEIRVIPHLDALVLLAEPAWQANVSFTLKGQKEAGSGVFVPRSRRWIRSAAANPS